MSAQCSACVLGWLHLSASDLTDNFSSHKRSSLIGLSEMTGKRSVVLPLLHWLLSDLFDRFSTSANFWLWKCKKLETGFSFLLYFILRWPSPIPLLEILLYNFIYVQPWRLLWIPNLYIPFTFPCGCTIVISIRFTFQRELFLHTFFFFFFLPIPPHLSKWHSHLLSFTSQNPKRHPGDLSCCFPPHPAHQYAIYFYLQTCPFLVIFPVTL